MAEFDINSYLRDRAAAEPQGGTPDLTHMARELEQRSARKAQALEERSAVIKARAANNEKSLVNHFGVDPDGLAGFSLNNTASFVSALTRELGNVAALPFDAAANAYEQGITQEERDAYARVQEDRVRGRSDPNYVPQASDADRALMQQRYNATNLAQYPEGHPLAQTVKADARHRDEDSYATTLERIRASNNARTVSGIIDRVADTSGLVHTGQRDRLSDDLVRGDNGVDDVADGWQAMRDGDLEKGAPQFAKGMARAVGRGLGSVMDNPAAVTEYMVETGAQLLTAVGMPAGMVTTTMGYASDLERQGIEQYKKDNDGAMPPPEVRQQIVEDAVTAGVLNFAGDASLLGGVLGRSASSAIGAGRSLARTSRATATGAVTEAGTEGAQTYYEGQATLNPASRDEIFEGAVIGGAAGGGISGGSRGAQELGQATAEHAQARTEQAAEVEASAEVYARAVESGDPGDLANPASKEYSPARAVTALYRYASQDGRTEEEATQARTRADSVIEDLSNAVSAGRSEIEASSEAGRAEKQAEINAIREQSEELADLMQEQLDSAPTLEGRALKRAQRVLERDENRLEQAIKARDGMRRTTQSTEQTASTVEADIQAAREGDQDAGDRVTVLAMEQPELFDDSVLLDLADSETSGLSTEQRGYLRQVSQARQAENRLKSQKDVRTNIIEGGKGYIGTRQYRQRIGAALRSGDMAQAVTQLGRLERFADQHEGKAVAAEQALEQAQSTNKRVNLVYDRQAGWQQVDRRITKEERDSNAGLVIYPSGSEKLVAAIQEEAPIVRAAAQELRSAFTLSQAPQQENVAQEAANEPSEQASTEAEPVTTEPDTQETASDSETDTRTDPVDREAAAPEPTDNDTDTAAESVPQPEPVVEAEPAPEPAKGDDLLARTRKLADAAERFVPVSRLRTLTAAVKEVSGTVSRETFDRLNLVQAYFTQKKPGKQPLVEDGNFVEQLAYDVRVANRYLEEPLTEQQETFLEVFAEKVNQWRPVLQASLLPKNGTAKRKPLREDYYYTDMIEFLRDESGNLDPNVENAILAGAFQWVQETGLVPQYNDDAAINKMVGRAADAEVSPELRQLLAGAGTRDWLVQQAIGKHILQSLGLKPTKDAPSNHEAQLQASLGAHALMVLEAEGIVERTAVPATELAAALDEQAENTKAQHYFIKLARDEQGADSTAVEIVTAAANTQSVLSKLLGTESEAKGPSLSPVTLAQKLAKNSDRAIPKRLRHILDAEGAKAHVIRNDMVQVYESLERDDLEAIAGVVDQHNTFIHAANVKGVEGKNDALRRELDRFNDFLAQLRGEEGGLDTSFYFPRSVWKMQRVGLDTNLVNPQTSKVQRHMMAMKDWETEIDMNDPAQVDGFMLAIADALDIATDKQTNATSLKQVQKALSEDVYADALVALNKASNGEVMEASDRTAIVAAVKKGGAGFHTLDGLTAYAGFLQAQSLGQETFTTSIMREVDGVTNGPMLAQLQLGAARTAQDLANLIQKGGFFVRGSGATQYGDWRSRQGSTDLYETMATGLNRAVKERLKEGKIPALVYDAIQHFTGPLEKVLEDGSTKLNRNLVKTPLTAMIFGSGLGTVVRNMGESLEQKFYDQIQEIANDGKMTDQQKQEAVTTSLQALAYLVNAGDRELTVPSNLSVSDALGYTLSKGQRAALVKAFSVSMGKDIRTVMETQFADFIENRKKLNAAAQAAYEVYNAAYDYLKKDMLAQLAERDELPRDSKGNQLQDLTEEQEKALRLRLKKIEPVVHTPFSKAENNLSAGIFLAKHKRSLAKTEAYAGTARFNDGGPYKETQLRGMEAMMENPGVAGLIMAIHSSDSAISARAYEKLAALNVHDAHGLGLNDVTAGARNLNQETFQVLMEYSVPTEMADALERTLTNLREVVGNPNDIPEMRAAFDAINGEIASRWKQREDLGQVRDQMASAKVDPIGFTLMEARQTANRADRIKFETLGMLESVDQYAMEGGNFLVNDMTRQNLRKQMRAPRRKIMDPIEELRVLAGSQRPEEEIEAWVNQNEDAQEADATSEVEQGNFTEQPAANETVWGRLGNSPITSDPAIVKLFAGQRTLPAGKLINALYRMSGDTFTQYVLAQAKRTLPADLPVTLLDRNSPNQASVNKPASGTAMAWADVFTKTPGIYVKGPDYAHSGVSQEMMVHELMHASVATTIQAELDKRKANPKYRSEALDLVEGLEDLLADAKARVNANETFQQKYGQAVENVHELVSYGMSNAGFQQEVLAPLKASARSRQNMTGNRFITGMQRFIQALTGLFFKGSKKNQQARLRNGMGVMISHTAGLMSAAQESVERYEQAKANQTPLEMRMDEVNEEVRQYSTEQVFDALADPEAVLSPSEDTALRALLNGIVNKLHGPAGTYKDQAFHAETPAEVFAQALASGQAPFASRIIGSRFALNDQQAFVAEQVEATMRAALDSDPSAYRELQNLWVETKERLSAKDFFDGDWDSATPNEKAIAQHQYDFLFKLDGGGKSDHLARFAALSMVEPRLKAKMDTETVRRSKELRGMKFGEALLELFRRALNLLNGKLTGTYNGQKANERMKVLVQQLVDVESRKKQTVEQKRQGIADRLDNQMGELSDKVRDKLEKFGRSDFIKNRKSGFVRAAGSLTSTVAGDRGAEFLDHLQRMRDTQQQKRQGLFAAVVSEVQVAADGAARSMQALFREVTKRNEHRRMQFIDTTRANVMGSFANEGRDLTDQQKAALTKVLLRTGMADLLEHYDMNDLTRMTTVKGALDKEIQEWESQLGQFGSLHNYYQGAAKDLGYHMATGRAQSKNVMLNAHNIAFLVGTDQFGSVSNAQGQAAIGVLDPLVSLYALRYSDSQARRQAGEVMKAELQRGNRNGAEATLIMAKHMQDMSREALFDGSPVHMQKGYSAEILDPYKSVKVATPSEGIQLTRMGWVKAYDIQPDSTDPSQEPRALYVIRDGGQKRFLSGVFSTTGEHVRGTELHSGISDPSAPEGVNRYNQRTQQKVLKAREQQVKALFNRPLNYDPAKAGSQDSNMVPVINGQGEVVNLRYTMDEHNKDTFLGRKNDLDMVMGAMAGSLFDKPAGKAQNREAVEALHVQYQEDFANQPERYLEVSASSSDPRLKEAWHMLPDDTKAAVREVWGRDAMFVRADQFDLVFGYHKQSIADTFSKDREERNVIEQVFANLVGFLANLGKTGTPAEQEARTARLAQKLRAAEDIWQEVVKHLKDILVVKNIATLMGNIASNVSLLLWYGVPPKELVKNHRVALEGVIHYRRDLAERDRLQQMVDAGYAEDLKREQARIAELEDSLARNPVRELIEAGMLPTIVEDVDMGEDPFSYQSVAGEKLEPYIARIPQSVRTAGRWLYMTHDTPIYKILSQSTQMSDFVARYTLVEHATNRAKSPLSREQALQAASDMFINYDVPTHRTLQYMNDMGLLMFTKYYLRIQKTIMQLYRERPARALALIALTGFLPGLPVLMDSAFWNRLYSPFRSGALEYPGALDELGTVKAAMSPFN